MDIEIMLSNEPWYLSCWLFMAQLIITAWAFRPTWLFKKFDFFWYRFNRHIGLKIGIINIVAVFVILSAWLGFYLVLATGYLSTLVFLPSSLREEWSSRDLLTAALSFIGATAIVVLLLKHNEKRGNSISLELRRRADEIINKINKGGIDVGSNQP
jgi:hypothetical protein